jgi:hypothetical protein
MLVIDSEQFRYIRYADGSEELYDHFDDPWELKNLALNPEYQDVIRRHKQALPDFEVERGITIEEMRAQGIW